MLYLIDCIYNINDEYSLFSDYQHAQLVWSEFGMTTFKEYHDLYLKTDTLLLADVFESFRDFSLATYKLDPLHYMTSPSLTWDAMLKHTGIKLELLTDIDMYLFIENGLRGGVSVIAERFAKANNPEVPDYNPDEATTWISYEDMNNLYGHAMTRPQPTDSFKWESPVNFNVMEKEETDATGYILEVDLETPEELQATFQSYPLAPESMIITDDMLSPLCKAMAEEFNIKSGGVKKLVQNLLPKKKYAIHYLTLKRYIQLGMKLTKIHRILSFNQTDFMASYINMNSQLRAQATNDFEKDFLKLMNNSLFGKTMENLRKRVNINLVIHEDKLNKLVAQPSYKTHKVLSNGLVAVERSKVNLVLSRPIYIGMCVLDLSKELMYDFYYNVMMKKYGQDMKLLFTDTDSLCLMIETPDLFKSINEMKQHYDLSNFPKDHPMYSTINKKVPGKMKIETGSEIVYEFVGLKPKMYSVLYGKDAKEMKKAKGVSTSVVKRILRHKDYTKCLMQQKRFTHKMRRIGSKKHQIYTYEQEKISLNPYDDKRYLLDDGIRSLPYGHKNANV